MTSSRSSKLTALGLLVALSVVVAAPAAAVSVDDSSVSGEPETGTQISASVTLTELYQNPQWEPWTLVGETELTNVTWTLTFINPQGNEFDTRTYDGQTFNQSGISTEGDQPITAVRVEVTGVVPAPDEWTYPEEETFVVVDLTQARSEEGSQNKIETVETHHYTTGDVETPGSREARDALDSARAAIQSASAEDADTAEAESTFQNAVNAYQNGNFANAVDLAERAEEEANEAVEQKQSAEQRNELLMMGGGALVLLLLLGGGFWWYRQQGDDYDKLG